MYLDSVKNLLQARRFFMKYILSIVCVVVIGAVFAIVGLTPTTENTNQDYLRVHIRANSNSSEDQTVKYIVRDAVVEALIPLLSEAETKEEAELVLKENLAYIEKIADEVLREKGFNYESKAYISNEYFPTRTYDDLTLDSGYYDALILSLGTGDGNNWWCVVYPAFCFTNTKNSANYVYISKIWEIINSAKSKMEGK